MISIKKNTIKENSEELNNKFNYPTLINIYPKSNNHEMRVEKINEEIYQDLTLFKELVSIDIDVENNACTNYTISYNKNNIISILMEFTELLGINDITYINTYNYDISKNKKIKLNNIFKIDSKHIEHISKNIQKEVNITMKKNSYIYTEISFEEIRDFILHYEEHTFFFNSKEIVLCFSSYELGIEFPHPIKIRLELKQYKKYLTDYMLTEILEEVD